MKNIFILFGFLLLGYSSLYAQVPPPPPGGGQDPFAVPIDGGVGFLAAAGVAYGIKKWRDNNKDEEDIKQEF